MAYRALYREWRPESFSDVIGQNAVVNTLRRQITTGRIAHAYLFCGSKGTGKTSLAKIMSRAINCAQPNDGDPCGVCDVCKAILSESTLDVLELDAASNNSVDNIRDLLEQVRYPAQVGKYKVYIIDEVHMLSTAAFNALLKTLEEPPEHVVFILATTEPQRLPATILSRVQRFDIARISAPLIQQRMEKALQRLNIKAEPEAMQMIARAAEGAMRDAWSILDMAVSAAVDDEITVNLVRDILGSADKEFVFSFTQALAARDKCAVMQHIEKLIRDGHEAQVFLRDMARHIRSLLIVKVVDQDAVSLLQCTQEDEKRYRSQSKEFSQERLLSIMNRFMTADSELRYASSPRIGLEIAALQACSDELGEDNTALLARVAELEIKLAAMPETIAKQMPEQDVIEPEKEKDSTAMPIKKKSVEESELVTEANKKAEDKGHQKMQTEAADHANADDIWQAALKKLASAEPALFGVLKREQFLGKQDGVYRVQVAQARKGFSFANLRKQEKIDSIVRVLSDVTGQEESFEAVLEGAPNQKASVSENIQLLTETLGRDLLQIDESED